MYGTTILCGAALVFVIVGVAVDGLYNRVLVSTVTTAIAVCIALVALVYLVSNMPQKPNPVCPRCNQTISSEWEYCPSCGVSLNKV